MLPLAASSALTTVTFSIRPGDPPATVVSTPGMPDMALAGATRPPLRLLCPLRVFTAGPAPQAPSRVPPAARVAWRWAVKQARLLPGNVAATLIAGWVILALAWIARTLAHLW